MAALALAALLGLSGAACGDDDGSTSGDTDTTLVERGDQPGSGADGSVPDGDTPGNTPGSLQEGSE